MCLDTLRSQLDIMFLIIKTKKNTFRFETVIMNASMMAATRQPRFNISELERIECDD